MKKLGIILGFLVLTIGVNAQVKQNENGLYVNADGEFYTGMLENKENGQKLSEITIVAGLRNGEAKYYYTSGQLMETGVFKAGQKDGKWLRYNEAGITVGLAIYHLDKKNGTWMVWDDTGKKRFEMHYNMGVKTGVWYNWDEKGGLVSTKDFSTAN